MISEYEEWYHKETNNHFHTQILKDNDMITMNIAIGATLVPSSSETTQWGVKKVC